MIAAELRRLLDPRPLGRREAREVFGALTSETSDDVDRAALLVALSSRRPGPVELAEFAREMRRRAVPFPIARTDLAVDLCGSGGARRPSFNVSTVSAFVTRAAGLKVAKHGNRSRGICGSSDLLAALGLPILTSIPFARASYRRYGIAFLHAPLFHPATRAVGPVRARLGVPTLFNRLGPLTNPARVRCQVAGSVDTESARVTAAALRALGVSRGITMASDDGCDEFSPKAATTAFAWTSARLRRLRIRPADLLVPDDRQGSWSALAPPAAAEEAQRILAGGGGARRGAVLLTSGAALWIAGRAPSLKAGVERARGALDSGAAEDLLEKLRSLAGQFPHSQEA